MISWLAKPFKRYIANYLKTSLSKYINNLDLDEFSLSGEDFLVFRDLELNLDVVQETLKVPLAFEFTSAIIKELKIKVPWAHLLSQSIEVHATNLELVLTARDELSYTKMKVDFEERLRSDTGYSVDSSNSPFNGRLSRTGSTLNSPSVPKEVEQSWLNNLLAEVLANIEVKITNFICRYQTSEAYLALSVSKVHLTTRDESNGWIPIFQRTKTEQKVLYKNLAVKGIILIIDEISDDGSRLTDMDPFLSKSNLNVKMRLSLDWRGKQEEMVAQRFVETILSEIQENINNYTFFRDNEVKFKLGACMEIIVEKLHFRLFQKHLQLLTKLIFPKGSPADFTSSTVSHDDSADEKLEETEFIKILRDTLQREHYARCQVQVFSLLVKSICFEIIEDSPTKDAILASSVTNFFSTASLLFLETTKDQAFSGLKIFTSCEKINILNDSYSSLLDFDDMIEVQKPISFFSAFDGRSEPRAPKPTAFTSNLYYTKSEMGGISQGSLKMALTFSDIIVVVPFSVAQRLSSFIFANDFGERDQTRSIRLKNLKDRYRKLTEKNSSSSDSTVKDNGLSIDFSLNVNKTCIQFEEEGNIIRLKSEVKLGIKQLQLMPSGKRRNVDFKVMSLEVSFLQAGVDDFIDILTIENFHSAIDHINFQERLSEPNVFEIGEAKFSIFVGKLVLDFNIAKYVSMFKTVLIFSSFFAVQQLNVNKSHTSIGESNTVSFIFSDLGINLSTRSKISDASNLQFNVCMKNLSFFLKHKIDGDCYLIEVLPDPLAFDISLEVSFHTWDILLFCFGGYFLGHGNVTKGAGDVINYESSFDIEISNQGSIKVNYFLFQHTLKEFNHMIAFFRSHQVSHIKDNQIESKSSESSFQLSKCVEHAKISKLIVNMNGGNISLSKSLTFLLPTIQAFTRKNNIVCVVKDLSLKYRSHYILQPISIDVDFDQDLSSLSITIPTVYYRFDKESMYSILKLIRQTDTKTDRSVPVEGSPTSSASFFASIVVTLNIAAVDILFLPGVLLKNHKSRMNRFSLKFHEMNFSFSKDFVFSIATCKIYIEHRRNNSKRALQKTLLSLTRGMSSDGALLFKFSRQSNTISLNIGQFSFFAFIGWINLFLSYFQVFLASIEDDNQAPTSAAPVSQQVEPLSVSLKFESFVFTVSTTTQFFRRRQEYLIVDLNFLDISLQAKKSASLSYSSCRYYFQSGTESTLLYKDSHFSQQGNSTIVIEPVEVNFPYSFIKFIVTLFTELDHFSKNTIIFNNFTKYLVDRYFSASMKTKSSTKDKNPRSDDAGANYPSFILKKIVFNFRDTIVNENFFQLSMVDLALSSRLYKFQTLELRASADVKLLSVGPVIVNHNDKNLLKSKYQTKVFMNFPKLLLFYSRCVALSQYIQNRRLRDLCLLPLLSLDNTMKNAIDMKHSTLRTEVAPAIDFENGIIISVKVEEYSFDLTIDSVYANYKSVRLEQLNLICRDSCNAYKVFSSKSIAMIKSAEKQIERYFINLNLGVELCPQSVILIRTAMQEVAINSLNNTNKDITCTLRGYKIPRKILNAYVKRYTASPISLNVQEINNLNGKCCSYYVHSKDLSNFTTVTIPTNVDLPLRTRERNLKPIIVTFKLKDMSTGAFNFLIAFKIDVNRMQPCGDPTLLSFSRNRRKFLPMSNSSKAILIEISSLNTEYNLDNVSQELMRHISLRYSSGAVIEKRAIYTAEVNDGRVCLSTPDTNLKSVEFKFKSARSILTVTRSLIEGDMKLDLSCVTNNLCTASSLEMLNIATNLKYFGTTLFQRVSLSFQKVLYQFSIANTRIILYWIKVFLDESKCPTFLQDKIVNKTGVDVYISNPEETEVMVPKFSAKNFSFASLTSTELDSKVFIKGPKDRPPAILNLNEQRSFVLVPNSAYPTSCSEELRFQVLSNGSLGRQITLLPRYHVANKTTKTLSIRSIILGSNTTFHSHHVLEPGEEALISSPGEFRRNTLNWQVLLENENTWSSFFKLPLRCSKPPSVVLSVSFPHKEYSIVLTNDDDINFQAMVPFSIQNQLGIPAFVCTFKGHAMVSSVDLDTNSSKQLYLNMKDKIVFLTGYLLKSSVGFVFIYNFFLHNLERSYLSQETITNSLIALKSSCFPNIANINFERGRIDLVSQDSGKAYLNFSITDKVTFINKTNVAFVFSSLPSFVNGHIKVVKEHSRVNILILSHTASNLFFTCEGVKGWKKISIKKTVSFVIQIGNVDVLMNVKVSLDKIQIAIEYYGVIINNTNYVLWIRSQNYLIEKLVPKQRIPLNKNPTSYQIQQVADDLFYTYKEIPAIEGALFDFGLSFNDLSASWLPDNKKEVFNLCIAATATTVVCSASCVNKDVVISQQSPNLFVNNQTGLKLGFNLDNKPAVSIFPHHTYEAHIKLEFEGFVLQRQNQKFRFSISNISKDTFYGAWIRIRVGTFHIAIGEIQFMIHISEVGGSYFVKIKNGDFPVINKSDVVTPNYKLKIAVEKFSAIFYRSSRPLLVVSMQNALISSWNYNSQPNSVSSFCAEFESFQVDFHNKADFMLVVFKVGRRIDGLTKLGYRLKRCKQDYINDHYELIHLRLNYCYAFYDESVGGEVSSFLSDIASLNETANPAEKDSSEHKAQLVRVDQLIIEKISVELSLHIVRGVSVDFSHSTVVISEFTYNLIYCKVESLFKDYLAHIFTDGLLQSPCFILSSDILGNLPKFLLSLSRATKALLPMQLFSRRSYKLPDDMVSSFTAVFSGVFEGILLSISSFSGAISNNLSSLGSSNNQLVKVIGWTLAPAQKLTSLLNSRSDFLMKRYEFGKFKDLQPNDMILSSMMPKVDRLIYFSLRCDLEKQASKSFHKVLEVYDVSFHLVNVSEQVSSTWWPYLISSKKANKVGYLVVATDAIRLFSVEPQNKDKPVLFRKYLINHMKAEIIDNQNVYINTVGDAETATVAHFESLDDTKSLEVLLEDLKQSSSTILDSFK